MAAVEKLVPLRRDEPAHGRRADGLEEIIRRRVAFLTSYQDRAYADRYLDLVRRIESAERQRTPKHHELSLAVARYAFKLMAYKDEYEVARLYTDGSFESGLAETFEGDVRLQFHLAPPLFARRDPVTGHLVKKAWGAWVLPVFRCLAALRRLRGTVFDPFGMSRDRREERRLIADYFSHMNAVAAELTPNNHAAAIALASVPEQIRGYGHVKEQHLIRARAAEAAALAQFRDPDGHRLAAQ